MSIYRYREATEYNLEPLENNFINGSLFKWFKDGIKLTIDWYKKHMDWMNECTSGDYLDYYKKMYDNR